MKKPFILLIALLSTWFVSAQDCKYYEVLMQKANQLWAEGKFEQAFNQLTAAREHCPRNSALVDAQFVDFTNKIAQKYREAEAQKNRAEKETQNAKNATARADRSALINRLGALALQKSKTNDYTLAWHLAVQAYQYAYDSLEGRSIEPGVSSIMYDIISDTTNWLYKPIGRPHDEIRSAIFSPDAQSIITYAENSIDLWDKNGQLLKTLESGEILGGPVFSPDAEFMLTFANNTVHVWDKSIALIQSVEVNEPVRKAVFSPDGQSIFIMGTQAVYLCTKSGSPIQALERSVGIEDVAFSSDGHILTWNQNDNQLQMRDTLGKIILTLETAERIQVATFLPSCPENLNGKQYILTKTDDRTVSLWDEKGKQIKTLSAPRDFEKTAWSLDGQLMLSWKTDGFPLLSDKNGQLIKLLGDSLIGITGAEFSLDGHLILTWNFYDHEVWIWDKTGQLIQNFNTGDEIDFASFFSMCADNPKGEQYILTCNENYVYLCSQDGRLIKVIGLQNNLIKPPLFSKDGALGIVFGGFFSARDYDPFAHLFKNGKFFKTLDEVQDAVFSPDDQSFLAILKKGSANLLNQEGQRLNTFEPVDKAVFSPACPENPQGGQFLLTTASGKARLWRKNAQALQTLSNVSKVSFSPPSPQDPAGGQYMLTSADGLVRLWDKTGQAIQTLQANNTITSAVFSADGQRILTQGAQQAQLWDAQGQLIKIFENLKEGLGNPASPAAKISPDGQQILTLGSNELQLWDAQGHLIRTLQSSRGKKDAVFSPDGQRMLTYGDSAVILWAKNGQMLRVLESGAGFVKAIFSPNGAYILTSWGGDKPVFDEKYNPDVKLWDKNGQLIKRFDAGAFGIYKITFSPDGQSILGSSYDGIDRLWNREGQLINKIELVAPGSVEFAPDGRFFFFRISSMGESWIERYDRTGQKIRIFEGHTHEMGSLVFSPDDQAILTTHGKEAQLWDKTGKVLKTVLEGHTDVLGGAIFSPACPADPKGGQFMLTWGYDQTTRLWDKSGQPLRTIYGPVTNAQFSPDGQSILIFDENEKSMQHWEGLPQYIRSHTQLGAGDLLQAGAILDPKLLLEQQTPVELAEIGEVYLQRKDWAKAHLFYTTANQRKQSPEATIGLYKVAKQSRKTFDFKQFLAAEDATTLRQYGDFLYETAVLPSYHADEKRPYDTTLVPIVVQLYEKAERQAHSSETLIRLHVIALKKGQEFDLQRFFQAKNAKELRQYGNYLFDVSGLTNHDFALNADNRLLLQTAAQLYEKTEQVEHSVETLIRLYKIARKTGQTFDLQRFLATKNPSELAEYGNYFFTTAYQEKVPQTLPIEYNQWNTNPNEIRSKYDKSPLGPNEPSRTLLQFATQLYEKSEQLKHSAETLIRLHLMAEMTEQPFDFQRFLATDDVEELRQYADYLMSFQFPNYTTNIPYAQQAIRLGEKMLVLAAGTRQKMALARYYNWLGFCQLFIPDGAAAEISLRRALALDSTLLNLPIHLAHAQLLQGRYLDAEKFYLEYKDKPFKYRDYKTYFLGDFQTLEAQGVSHPDIARIRARLEDRKE